LMEQAMNATGLKTKRAVVEAGLRKLVQLGEQAKIRDYRGKLPWDADLDEMRRGR
ncbi:MAG: type II toxin-antitoxin system VapB family antitoxin, partial [Acidobacteriota bacterium]